MVAQLGASAAAARAHEELFSYWAAQRRSGRLPSRADISPEGFKRLLPTVSLIDVIHADDGTIDYRLRLAGTGLYSVFGREITGQRLSDVYGQTACDYWRRELDGVVASGRPAVGSHSMAWRGASHLTTLWLRLPLASDGERVDMILGYDAVLGLQGERAISGIRAA
ncbi:MAG: PAS domain-containing protein [Caulobacter sp.]|jgi:hypothetical protein